LIGSLPALFFRVKPALFFTGLLLILSCPQPVTVRITAMPEENYLEEAEKFYSRKPAYALDILNRVKSPANLPYKTRVLARLYLEQREYERCARLLDSTGWNAGLTDLEYVRILVQCRRWGQLAERATDPVRKGTALFQAGDYEKARELLNGDQEPRDYVRLYRAKTLKSLNEYDRALQVILDSDSIRPYLQNEYQDILFDLLTNAEDLNTVKNQLNHLKEPALREYVLLKYYDKKHDRARLDETAWRMIRLYPGSAGALYALALVKPQSSTQRRLVGLVYYHNAQYAKAIPFLETAAPDSTLNYYLGRSCYEIKSYRRATNYLIAGKGPEALYYRGRICENENDRERAIALYDSLYVRYPGSKYAGYGLRQKAFLLEDAGDTLKAVAAFLKINERNTKFRAALQLYRIGRLQEAAPILEKSSDPEYVYWLIRIRERLGQPVDSLKDFLTGHYPLSYYSLLKNRAALPVDTMPLNTWLTRLGDTLIAFDRTDSSHINRAIRYFELGELNYGTEELALVQALSGADLFYLSRLCAQYGADRAAINYALKLKEAAEKKDIYRLPIELFRQIYPVRYLFSLQEQKVDLSLFLAILWQESLFDPNATSVADARGLMQIIPETGILLAGQLKVDSFSLFDPRTSIRFGVQYYMDLYRGFNSPVLSLAGYNAGPVNVRRWLGKNPNSETDEFVELIPFSETRNYVKYILARQIIYQNLLADAEITTR
jgi:soluble lytic murein transglycosylase-like protein